MIEFFTSHRRALWVVAWRQFDHFGALVDEGLVGGEAPDEKAARARLRVIWVELLAARFDIVMIGKAVCVKAARSEIERATSCRLFPNRDARVVV